MLIGLQPRRGMLDRVSAHPESPGMSLIVRGGCGKSATTKDVASPFACSSVRGDDSDGAAVPIGNRAITNIGRPFQTARAFVSEAPNAPNRKSTPRYRSADANCRCSIQQLLISHNDESVAWTRASGQVGAVIPWFGTGRGNRTPTLLPELDFESSASTNSAIPAKVPQKNERRRLSARALRSFAPTL